MNVVYQFVSPDEPSSSSKSLYSIYPISCTANTHGSLGAQSHGEIIIQVSNENILNQIESRIFKIYLTEELGYHFNITLQPRPYPRGRTERWKLLETLMHIEGPTLDLGVWMPADFHTMPPHVELAGRLSTGYFGWFVPKRLIEPNDLPTMNLYTIFKDPNTSAFMQFVFDERILDTYTDSTANGHGDGDVYVPEQCKSDGGIDCVTLLAANRWQTEFVIKHINELKLYVKVKWFGVHLQSATRFLYNQFAENRSHTFGQKFVVLHYSPSEVIDTEIEYETITMPSCKDIASSNDTLCQYETMAVLKYSSSVLGGQNSIGNALREITFSRMHEKIMLRRYYSYTKGTVNGLDRIDALDFVACEWLRENKIVWSKWMRHIPQEIIYIGGIFPNTHASNRHHEGTPKMSVESVENEISNLLFWIGRCRFGKCNINGRRGNQR